MEDPRCLHGAVLLPSGKVLVVGGKATEDTGDPLASAELFDPTSGTWKRTGSMSQERQNHTVTLLRDGRGLGAGGKRGNGGSKKTFASAEIYDPQTEKWAATGPMAQDRCQFTAVLLADGRVLAVGGGSLPIGIAQDSAEIYDPKLGTWSAAGKMDSSRWNHRAVLLPNGQVLVVGGCNSFGNRHLSSVELFTPPGAIPSTGKRGHSRLSGRTKSLQRTPGLRSRFISDIFGPASLSSIVRYPRRVW